MSERVKLPHTSEYIMRGTSNGWGEYVGELIRCKDCIKKELCSIFRDAKQELGFCAWAERKEE